MKCGCQVLLMLVLTSMRFLILILFDGNECGLQVPFMLVFSQLHILSAYLCLTDVLFSHFLLAGFGMKRGCLVSFINLAITSSL